MLPILFGSKPVAPTRDLKLKVLNHGDDPLLYGVKDTLFLAIPGTITGKELKQRIHGQLNLPPDRIILLYCGAVIKDNSLLTNDMFEPTAAVSLEAEVFKPRIHVMLKSFGNSNADQLIVHSGEDSEDEEAREARLAAERQRLEEERLIKERLMLIRQLRLARDANSDEIKFELADELVNINCGSFIDLLTESGYADVGAFAYLTEAALIALRIPTKARIRVLALAGHFKQKLENMKKSGGVRRLSHQGQGQGPGPGQRRGSAASVGTTTSDDQQKVLKRLSMLAKQRTQAQTQQTARKVHSDEILNLMEKIHKDERVDEFGVPIDVLTRPSTHPHLHSHLHGTVLGSKKAQERFCCLKHFDESAQSRAEFIEQRAKLNKTKLLVAVTELSRLSTGDFFISRAVLKVLLQETLREQDYVEDVDEEEIEEVLDLSVMTAEEQNRRRLWTLPLCERPTVVVCRVDPDYHKSIQGELEERNKTKRQATMDWMVSVKKVPNHTDAPQLLANSNIDDEDKLFDLGHDTPVSLLDSTAAAFASSRTGGQPVAEEKSPEQSSCLPVAIYDVNVFVDTVVELLRELDKGRFQ